MKPIPCKTVKPIDKSVTGAPGKPIIFENLRIQGGLNCLNLVDSAYFELRNMDLGKPAGVPGETNHPLQLDKCSSGRIDGVTLRTAGSDGANLWMCQWLHLSNLRHMGELFTGKEKNSRSDIGRGLVIDGEGMGGHDITIDNSVLPSLTCAAGFNITLGPALNLTGPLQIGEGYENDTSRDENMTAYLNRVTGPLLFVGPKVKLVEVEHGTCAFHRVVDPGRRIKMVQRRGK